MFFSLKKGVFPVYIPVSRLQFYSVQKPVTMTVDTLVLGVKLTSREQEIWECVISGLSSREIAHKLSITDNTVANHRKSILRKKGLRNFSALIRENAY